MIHNQNLGKYCANDHSTYHNRSRRASLTGARKEQIMARGSEASNKIHSSITELLDSDKLSKTFLPKVSTNYSPCSHNPPVYITYRLNAWEDDKPLIRKYKDFMKKPV